MVLTFDDGPDARYTPGILRTLREYDVCAMFFVCREMAADHKDLLREMADDGHIVGNHTWNHPLLTRLTRPGMRSEMERTCEIVQDAYGEAPLWFRATYGAWNRATLELGAELGMEPLAWTVDSGDLPAATAPALPSTCSTMAFAAGGGVPDCLPFRLDAGYHLTVPRRRST
jgi:peptidoglycan/xylan/chitin deacetylase (PgdA/CDA1 family)